LSVQTRLSLVCDRIIEAGWLAAAIVVPLFFNVYSSRVFEPDKLSLLRSIALVMASAWVVKFLEQRLSSGGASAGEGDGPARSFLRTPLVIPTLIMVGVYLLTTVTSVVPRISFWGSYQRLQGTYTFLSYVMIFMLMLDTLRSRQQLQRLLTVIMVTSLPIALYGIVQHFQLDPLPWGGDVTARVASNMGNAIFVAAYLIMVVPITMGRFVLNLRSFQGAESQTDRNGPFSSRLGWTAVSAALLAIQALCLTYVFGYQLFFLSDVEHVAGGLGYYALLVSALLASLTMALFFAVVTRKHRLSGTAETAGHVMLFAGQSLSLSYFLLLIFRLNYVVLTGGVATEFLALGVMMVLFIVAFWFTFREEALGDHLLGVLYGFVLSVQLICIFFTKSRGPWIGLVVGLFVFAFIFAVRRRMTWLWVGATVAALVGVLFLAVLNVPDSPLAPLRNLPYVGRLGQIFETETGTGRVRVLIWEGVIDLIKPHEPIGLPPDQLDELNPLRPLVGYGPESMFVAYNRFYPPELGHYEARNASPDRAHNETFDALAMTGWVGFFAYMFLFGSLLYYGLKWLGFASDRRQRILYVVLWVLGGAAFALGARMLEGTWRFSGVALAVGITFGFLAYLVIHALTVGRGEEKQGMAFRDQVLLIALFSALVAHFIEIHFGIAVAATRTYFWMYSALLVVIGLNLWEPADAEGTASQPSQSASTSRGSRRGRRRRRDARQAEGSSILASIAGAFGEVGPLAVLTGLVMATLSYDHVTGNFDPAAGGFSVPWLMVLTWLASTAIVMFEIRADSSRGSDRGTVAPLLAHLVISLGIFFAFTAIHYSLVSYEPNVRTVDDLVAYSGALSNTIVLYYGVVLGTILLTALALSTRIRNLPSIRRWYSVLALAVLAVAAGALTWSSNVSLVRADTHYKQGLNLDQQQQWDGSLALYEESVRLAPQQDWYYLFMARAILEKIRAVDSDEGRLTMEPQSIEEFLRLTPQQVASLDRESLFHSAQVVLTRAREINLLNTDHSANLGRLYRIWAENTADAERRQERWQQSISYYQEATTLSPHNAQLFNEWGLVYVIVGQYDQAIAKYEESLALDREFAQTYMLLGDAYTMKGDTEAAAGAYQKALELQPSQVNPRLQLCAFLAQEGKLEQAAEYCEEAARLAPQAYQAHRNLAIIYRDMGRLEDALEEARIARELAPEGEKASWDSLVAQLEATAQ
jgi:tetratricopeptide (TPR) repeat protein/O-antigen ligase